MESINIQNRLTNLEIEVVGLKNELNELRKDILQISKWDYRNLQNKLDMINDDMAQ